MRKIAVVWTMLVLTAMLAASLCTQRVMAVGLAQGGDTPTPAPTYTLQPTYTPLPTYTPFPTQAPLAQPTAAPTAAAMAAPTVESRPGFEVGDQNGKFVLGGAFTLRSGERLLGDLVVFGGVATLEGDTRVDGNIVIIGGAVDAAGRVSGDLVLIGGEARLRSTAEVDGQLVRVGGGLTKDAGAQIHGGEQGGAQIPPIPPIRPVVPTPRPFRVSPNLGLDLYLGFVGRMMRAVSTTVVLAILAIFVVALWREPVERVNRTITSAAGISWVVGFLTPLAFAVVVPALAILSAILILVCVGFLGIGAIAIASLALVLAWVMGWIVVGQLVGERLLNALNMRNVTHAASAALGTAVITLLWLGLEPLCGLGWLFFAVLSPLGLGAVVLTRFGTREYTNGNILSSAPVPSAPVAPVAPVPPVAPEPPQFAPVSPSAPSAASVASTPSTDSASDESKPTGE